MSDAAESVAAWRARDPVLTELAEVVSLALHCEPDLLRQARLLIGADDPGLEADLWFSAMVESRGPRGIVLLPELASVLRADLARRNPVRFEQARQMIATLHASAPWSIRAEEALYHYSARGAPGDRERVEAILRSVGARLRSEQSSRDVARWVLRALDRMPPEILAHDIARGLGLGADVRLGGGRTGAYQDLTVAMPWLPDSMETATVHVRRVRDDVEFGTERMPGGVPIEVPRTDPLVLHVVWHDGVADRLEPVRLRAGEIQRVRVPAKTLELRTLLGARFGLRPSDTREPETPSGLDFTSLRARHSPFFGRENEIGHLRQTMLLRSNGWILLTGPTGVGKSAVLCRLLDLLEREGAPVLMHFLEGGPARWAKTKIVEDSLRAQAWARLAENPELRSELTHAPLDEVLARTARLNRRAEPLHIALDGLDAAEDLPYLVSLLGSRQTPGVRFIATIADEKPLEALGITAERLEIRPDRNVCAAYLDYHAPRLGLRLQGREQIQHADIATSEESARGGVVEAQVLLDRADGICGRLAAMLEWLAANAPPDQARTPIPPTLYGGFDEVWSRTLRDPRAAHLTSELMAVLCAAREPLPWKLLEKVLVVDSPLITTSERVTPMDVMAAFHALAKAGLIREVAMENVPDAEREDGPWFEPSHATVRSAVRERISDDHLNQAHDRLSALVLETVPAFPASAARYGLRHAVHHLIASRQVERALQIACDLHHLNRVRQELGMEAVIGMLADTEEARPSSPHTTPTQSQVEVGWPPLWERLEVVKEIREVLRHARERLTAVPFNLIPLVIHGLMERGWSEERLEVEFREEALAWVHIGLLARHGIDEPASNGERRPAAAWAQLPTGHLCDGDAHGNLHLWEPGDSNSAPLASYGSAVCALGSASLMGATPEVADVIAGFEDGHVVRFSIPGGQSVWDVEPHAGPVIGISAIPGNRIATWSEDGTVKILNAESGTVHGPLLAAADRITGFITDRDGRIGFAVSRDGTLRAWFLDDGALLDRVVAHHGGVTCLGGDLDGRRLLTGGEDGIVRAWAIDPGATPGNRLRPIATLLGHQGPIRSCGFMATNQAFSCGADGTIRVWRLNLPESNDPAGTAEEIRVLKAGAGSAEGFIPLHDRGSSPKGWLSFTSGGSVLYWSQSLEPARGLQLDVPVLAAFRDARTGSFQVGTADGRLVEFRENEPNPAGKPVVSCAVSMQGSVLFSDTNGSCQLIDPRPDRKPVWLEGQLCAINGASDFWVTARNSDLIYWRLAGQKVAVHPLALDSPADTSEISALGLSGPGRWTVTGHRSGNTLVWERRWRESTLHQVARLDGHRAAVTCVAIDDQETLVATTSEDGSAIVWSVADSALLMSFNPKSGPLTTCAFAPRRCILATGGTDMAVRLWDTETGSQITVLAGHRGVVRGIAFTEDGRYLISSGEDATIRLWDIDSGAEVEVYHGRSGFTCLAQSRRAGVIAAGDEQGQLRVLRVPGFRRARKGS